jgi:5'-nucleotidase
MRILITNDDGIYAPGLALMERIAKTLSDDVLVVAPEYDQSGVAHSLTLNDPRFAKSRNGISRCGHAHRLRHPQRAGCSKAQGPISSSGVNNGQNVADDVTIPVRSRAR